MATVLSSFMNRESMSRPPKKKAAKKGTARISASLMEARSPARTRSCRPAPRFWAEKLLVPFPRVVTLVMQKVFSLIAAE